MIKVMLRNWLRQMMGGGVVYSMQGVECLIEVCLVVYGLGGKVHYAEDDDGMEERARLRCDLRPGIAVGCYDGGEERKR